LSSLVPMENLPHCMVDRSNACHRQALVLHFQHPK
jgi:hypothetical protein